MTVGTAHCENCTAPLQGDYCHRCGQSIHNPIRHAGHAIEEFFEAFWHLDGRLWRTLCDLMVPGRIAGEYLAGHRARYIPPLRLFVVLSVLTFFIGALSVRPGDAPVEVDTPTPEIEQAATIEQVVSERDRMLAELRQAQAETGIPGVDSAFDAAKDRVRTAADARIRELGGTPAAFAPKAEPGAADGDAGSLRLFSDEPWDPQRNPLVVDWLPDFANDWINDGIGNMKANLERMDGRSELWMQMFMGSLPSALFVLVPVFALLLKIAYLFTPRLYLEHMVVALYSHAFLLIALTVMFLLSGIGSAVEPRVPWLAAILGMLGTGVFLAMPVYLLLMQRRVYRQRWWLTVLKYMTVGSVYLVLLAVVTACVFLLRLAQA